MKGIFVTEKNKINMLEIPEPSISPYEALVEVLACGICNSTDWKIINEEFGGNKYPILFGHESVGRIIKVGDKVRSFKIGDMVLRSNLRDEHLVSVQGHSAWGGFVEKSIVTDVWAEQGVEYNSFSHPQQIVPSNISPVEAAAMITLKECISCLENTDVKQGHSLAIVGTGPVAQALTFFAKLSGIEPVVVFGRRKDWESCFLRLGADAYVYDKQPLPEVKKIIDRGGFDRVIEAVGSQSALSQCLKLASVNGRVNVYGVPSKFDHYNEKELSDSRVFRSEVLEADAHQKLLSWIEEGKVILSDWVSHVMDWTDYQAAFNVVKEKKANKVILKL